MECDLMIEEFENVRLEKLHYRSFDLVIVDMECGHNESFERWLLIVHCNNHITSCDSHALNV